MKYFTTLLFLIIFLNFSSQVISAEEKEILVKLKADSEEIVSQYQVAKDEGVSHKILAIPEEEYDETLKKLESDPRIEYVEEKIPFHYLTNDSFIVHQQSDFQLINVSQAWEQYNPKKKPIIAVLDSGVDVFHRDVTNKIYKPYNVLNSSSNVRDNVGHGTHVAGIVGAETGNGIGVASIVKDAYLMPVKVGDEFGGSNLSLAQGINYATENGATIINISLGSYEYSKVVHEAVQHAVEKGIFIIAAAGNDGTNSKMYPAAYKEVLGVAAIDSKRDRLTDFSNFGDWVDVSAPGSSIFSTCSKGIISPFKDCEVTDDYMYSSGSSMSSPMVASMAGLLSSQDPELTNHQKRHIIEESSNIDSSDAVKYKHGRVDVLSSLELYHSENRLSGKTSVHTSSEIAKYGWDTVERAELKPTEKDMNTELLNRSGKYALLASNQSFSDSLAASALAAKLDAPIFLTFPNKMYDVTASTMHELGVTDVILLGGENAIPKEIERLLKQEFNILRLSGTDRFSTSVEINDYVAKQGGEVIITSGMDFPDALSISSYASTSQIPIVFVHKNGIPDKTEEFLQKYNFETAYVVGGTAAVSDSIFKELGKLSNPIRISGKDRYETNVEIINYFDKGQSKEVIFATGKSFPDALAGGILASKQNAALLLVNKEQIPTSIKKYLIDKVENSREVVEFQTLGGTIAIPSNVKWKLDNLIYESYYEGKYE
ncbi:cell wall-binding repeat-containing protein [Salipaludibacillus sp. CF4.18]|uniref:cell wall-binding repeat-containing protein n=1 Tax=Salipaludibacillus sp. CF4.18 TaxID=3373081 RepID=UPI003EE5391A